MYRTSFYSRCLSILSAVFYSFKLFLFVVSHLFVTVCVCIVVNSLTHVLSLTSACHALSMSKTSKFVTLLIVTKTRKLFYFTIYKFNNNYYYTL